MKMKTLFLGSAAALVTVAGGAQAADLTIAEPVEAVKVCDAFGVGYWYIPGTQTCIKIGGSVEADVNFHTVSTTLLDSDSYSEVHLDPSLGLINIYDWDPGVGDPPNNHASNWDFVTEAKLNFTAKTVTDYGDLVGYVGLIADSNNSQFTHYRTVVPADDINDADNSVQLHTLNSSNDRTVYLEEAYLSLGWVLAGYTASTFDYGGDLGTGAIFRSDYKIDQARLSWAMGGFGIMLGIEDPRDRWGTALSATYNMPDIVAAVTASQDQWDGKLAVGFAQIGAGSAWGVLAGATIKLGSIAPGDLLRIQAAYGNGSYTYKTVTGTNDTWSIYAGFKHFWSARWSSVLEGSYASQPTASTSMWTAGANLVWAPVTGFSAALQGVYTQPTGGTGAWTGKVALKRSW
jgi:hypothetical protein